MSLHGCGNERLSEGPLVSVLMSAHNEEQYLGAALESLWAQTYPSYELVVVDDASTDGTSEVLDAHGRRAQDKGGTRFVVVKSQENLGLAASLNRGREECRGELIARQDADDVSYPNRIAWQVAQMTRAPQVVGLVAGFDVMDGQGVPIGRHCKPEERGLTLSWKMLFYNAFGGHGTVMLQKKALQEVGGYDPEFRYAQDYELWTRLSWAGELAVSPNVVGAWRRHDAGVSCSASEEQRRLASRASANALEALLGERPSLDTVEALARFFRPHLPGPLGGEEMDGWLQAAFDAFFSRVEGPRSRVGSARRRVCLEVARQYARWARFRLRSIDLGRRAALSAQALSWALRSLDLLDGSGGRHRGEPRDPRGGRT